MMSTNKPKTRAAISENKRRRNFQGLIPVADAEAILLAREISCDARPDGLIENFMRIVLAQLGAERAVMALATDNRFEVISEARVTSNGVDVSCRKEEFSDASLPVSIACAVEKNREVVFINHSSGPSDFTEDAYIRTIQPHACLMFPLLRQDQVIGFLYAENRARSSALDRAKVRLLAILGAQTAVSIENARVLNALMEKDVEREITEEKLRRSEALLAEGQRISGTGAWTFNAESGEMVWSEQVYVVWGIQPTTHPPAFAELMKLVKPSDRKALIDAYTEALTNEVTDEITTAEFSVNDSDGASRRLKLVLRPRSKAHERPRLYIGTTTDVTERRASEDALRKSEMYLSEAQRLSNIGSLNWIPGSGMLHCSRHARRILDVGENVDVVLEEVLRKVHRDDIASVEAALTQAGLSNENILEEFRVITRTGRVQYLRMVARPSMSTTGIPEYVGALVDITENHLAQIALMESQEKLARATRLSVLGELIASIANEIKQPLMSITANGGAGIRWIDRPVPSIDGAKNSFAAIVESAVHASDVIDRIRVLFLQIRGHRRLVDPHDVIEEVVPLVRREAEKCEVRIRTAVESRASIRADNVQIQQVLINLIMNALHATQLSPERDKEVLIKVGTVDDKHVRVSVSDSGIGLSKDAIEHVFEPVFPTKLDGAGLGLSICRSIIHEHGGKIGVVANEARGVTFYFDLPVAGGGDGF
jgi:signal transduction histidine kinase